MWQRMRDRLDVLHARAQEARHPVRRRLIGAARVALDLWHQLKIDQSVTAASALAFTTLVSLVPLMAVSFAVFRAITPSEELTRKIGSWLVGTLLADSVSEVTKTLEEILNRVRGETIGLLGFAFLLLTAVALFLSVEKTFNRIWRVSASRPLFARLTSFYAVLTLSPALVAGGFWVNDYLEEHLSFGAGLFSVVAPWVLQVTALLVAYKLLPHTQVRWRAALTGAIFAAIGFSLMQWVFDLYVGKVFSGSSAARLYGSFALIPIFFLWVYVVWIVVLAGAELAYVSQNRRGLGSAVLLRRSAHPIDAPPSGYLIARVFFELAGNFRLRLGGLNTRQIADRLQIEQAEVQPAVLLLKNGGLVLLVDGEDEQFVPALPLDQITLASLVRLGDAGGYSPGQLKGDHTTARLEEALVAARHAGDACLMVDMEHLLQDQPVERKKSTG